MGGTSVSIDASTTISIGTSTATGITIGNTSSTVSFPGSISITGAATTTNLSITSLAGASGCLSVSSSGAVTTSTCSTSATVMPAAIKSSCMFEYLINEASGTTLTDSCASSNGTFAAGGQAPTWQTLPLGITLNQSQSLTNSTTFANMQTFMAVIKPDLNCLKNTDTVGTGILASTNNANYIGIAPSSQIFSLYNGSTVPATMGNAKAAGYESVAITLGNPNVLYINGTPVSGYAVQCTSGLTSGTGFRIGDYQAAPGIGFGYCGSLYYVTGNTAILTASQIGSMESYVEAQMKSKNITLADANPLTPWFVTSGDSITQGFGTTGNNYLWSKMWQKFTQDLLPTEVNIVNLGVSAQSLSGSSGLLVRDLTAVDNLKKQYDSVSPFIVGVFAGTNDLASLSRSTTQVYGDLQTYNTNRQAAGEKSIVFTILPRNSINANRDTVNGCIRDGFSGTNAGCGGGQLPANAIVYAGFDPNMGQDNQTSTSWFSSDGVHPSNAGYALIATYVAPAVMRAIGTPSAPVWLRFTVSNNGTSTWTIAPNGNTAGPSIAIPSATSSSIPIYYLGPKYKLCGAELKTTTQFSATGLTTLQATIGDSVGGSTFYSSSQYNMMTAPGATNFQDTQILNSKTWAGSNVTLEINGANQNLNAQSNLAGAIDVSLCVTSVP